MVHPCRFSNGCLASGKPLRKLYQPALAVTSYLGVFGMPGFTGYAGPKIICKPKPSKKRRCRRRDWSGGIACRSPDQENRSVDRGNRRSPEKCEALLHKFVFDASVDHIDENFAEQLAAACPYGIDVYFENVCGAVWQTVFPLLNRSHGFRFADC